jgi:hypothetical protein
MPKIAQEQVTSRCVYVFITAVPITKLTLFAWGETSEEPGTFTQGASVFPGSPRLGIEPKTPGWPVRERTTSPSGIWNPPRAGLESKVGQVIWFLPVCVCLLQYLLHWQRACCSRGGREIVDWTAEDKL